MIARCRGRGTEASKIDRSRGDVEQQCLCKVAEGGEREREKLAKGTVAGMMDRSRAR